MLQSVHVHTYKPTKRGKLFLKKNNNNKKETTVPSLHQVCCTDFVALLWNISEFVVL